ncbi:sigma-70 family RNA polymerase sigma factor [Undibacterium sp. Di24W]|uniref:sigma-70 family RNA polymerase sigma factor n=1 Tax=Undibacterium sp. Di24W TaxID=3413033 RepID=UPI003BF4A640
MAINLTFHQQLTALRPQLLRFARQKIRDEAIAEDTVQETLLAVLESPDRYAGKSSLSTYVISILKFKIIDDFRKSIRHITHNATQGTKLANNRFDEDIFESATTCMEEDGISKIRYGITQSSLCSESNPLTELEQKNFFVNLEIALHDLPPKSARAFTLSDCMELDSDEICEELGITKNNLMVSVHRARHALRSALVHLHH